MASGSSERTPAVEFRADGRLGIELVEAALRG